MKSKVAWTVQVKEYVNSKAPDPRRRLWQEIKGLVEWDGRENPPRFRHLEDEWTGYSRVRVDRDRVIFREGIEAGRRTIFCIAAGPRNTVYETFEELALDDLAD